MIDTLFPPAVCCLWTTDEPDLGLLYRSEFECVRLAAPKRQREFAMGRLLARRALRQLGVERFPLLVSGSRAPQWPVGIVGSISHSTQLCAVAVARRTEIGGLGLDVEPAVPLCPELLRLVLSDAERRAQQSLGGDPWLLAKITFSAKETVFKCVYPLVSVFLEFHDCAIELSPSVDSFRAQLRHPDLPPFWGEAILNGRISMNGGHVITTLCLSSHSTPRPSETNDGRARGALRREASSGRN